MSRTTKKDELAQRQDAAAPFLFDDENLPTEPAALESVRLRRYEHTGARLLEDDGKAFRLVEMLLNGGGTKRISREMQISRHTVRAARRELVRQGKLAPYKQRVVDAMEDAIEAGVIRYRDALEDGVIPAGQIPVGVGIFHDKRALLLGEPTSITAAAVDPEARKLLTVDALNAYIDTLSSASPKEDPR